VDQQGSNGNTRIITGKRTAWRIQGAVITGKQGFQSVKHANSPSSNKPIR
jgi:hypothetical protein